MNLESMQKMQLQKKVQQHMYATRLILQNDVHIQVRGTGDPIFTFPTIFHDPRLHYQH